MIAGRISIAAFYLAALAGALHTGTANAAEQVGDAKRVLNLVTGAGAAGSRELRSSDPVYRAERISADSGSRGELQLSDGSKLIVGENSSITLDNFVLGEKGFKSATIRVAKGAFRYISGESPKGAVKFKTPLASIGVRGTTLDVYVDDTGATRVVVLSGEVRTCTTAGQCITTRRACDIVEVSSGTEIKQLDFLRSNGRPRQTESQEYSLTENQQRHSPGWRAPVGGCSARAALEIPNINPNGGENDRNFPPPPPPPPPPDDEEEDDDEDCDGCAG